MPKQEFTSASPNFIFRVYLAGPMEAGIIGIPESQTEVLEAVTSGPWSRAIRFNANFTTSLLTCICRQENKLAPTDSVLGSSHSVRAAPLSRLCVPQPRGPRWLC